MTSFELPKPILTKPDKERPFKELWDEVGKKPHKRKSSNKKMGTNAEYRYMYKNYLGQYAGHKSYSSLGLFDLIFIDKNLVTRLVQLKYSSIGKARIEYKEIMAIRDFVSKYQLKDISYIWVGCVLWNARKEPYEVRLN